MYSSFEQEDIKVTDSTGLFDFLMAYKEKDGGNNDYIYKPFFDNLIEGKAYSFEEWDNIKLISYWYDNQVDFLDNISKYIEGWVEFSFETPDEVARISFNNGETIFEVGRMEYTKLKADDMYSGIKE